MALRGDSYGSVDEVLAFTMHFLGDETTYNSTTRPTLTAVEKFIDRTSGYVNVALRGVGLTTPITNSTAKLVCDDWVVNQAVGYVELTHRSAGFSEAENARYNEFLNMRDSAAEFAAEVALSFKRLGVGVSEQLSQGLKFTGIDAKSQRSDPDDSTKRQPIFERGQFDDQTTSAYNGESEDY